MEDAHWKQPHPIVTLWRDGKSIESWHDHSNYHATRSPLCSRSMPAPLHFQQWVIWDEEDLFIIQRLQYNSSKRTQNNWQTNHTQCQSLQAKGSRWWYSCRYPHQLEDDRNTGAPQRTLLVAPNPALSQKEREERNRKKCVWSEDWGSVWTLVLSYQPPSRNRVGKRESGWSEQSFGSWRTANNSNSDGNSIWRCVQTTLEHLFLRSLEKALLSIIILQALHSKCTGQLSQSKAAMSTSNHISLHSLRSSTIPKKMTE